MDLLALAKENLRISATSTGADNEIVMLINSAIGTLERIGIDTKKYIHESLIIGYIMLYIKARFGMININEKEIAKRREAELFASLHLGYDYKKGKT